MYSRVKGGVSHASRIIIARSRPDNRFMTNVKETLCPKGSPHARNGSVTHEERIFISRPSRKGMPRSVKVAPIRDKFHKCALDDDDEGIGSMTKIRCRICELLGEDQGLNHGLSHPCHLTNLNHLRPGLNYSPLPNMNYLNHGLLNGLYLPQLKDMMLAAYLLRANRARCREAGSRIAYKRSNAKSAPSDARSMATHDCTGKENSPTAFPRANKPFLARLDLPPVARNSICIFSRGF
ncbi:hypothetical protein ALC62_13895 [Cyphomyrmex costatus]|uniref:Uncharacterized protein n=1 Tax=Cyphomyrmex costatus TaxID=456900 RepID=A0A195C3P0_9HYME|nr:hypothetical protein ALC62_13895 [Cyphomyrmex costatus]